MPAKSPDDGQEFRALRALVAELRDERSERNRSRRLECAECGWPDDDGHGWTLRLDTDDDLVAFCPECDEREFGDG